MPEQKRIRCPVCGMMGWTTSLRRDPSFETYEQEGLGRGKGLDFKEDGHDTDILQLELYKLLSCLEEMMERGWITPKQLLKWVKRHIEEEEKEKWEEPEGKWGRAKWEGKKEKDKWEEPEGKWGRAKW